MYILHLLEVDNHTARKIDKVKLRQEDQQRKTKLLNNQLHQSLTLFGYLAPWWGWVLLPLLFSPFLLWIYSLGYFFPKSPIPALFPWACLFLSVNINGLQKLGQKEYQINACTRNNLLSFLLYSALLKINHGTG